MLSNLNSLVQQIVGVFNEISPALSMEEKESQGTIPFDREKFATIAKIYIADENVINQLIAIISGPWIKESDKNPFYKDKIAEGLEISIILNEDHKVKNFDEVEIEPKYLKEAMENYSYVLLDKHFLITFKNTSSEELVLHLGTILGGPKIISNPEQMLTRLNNTYPNAVKLILSDSSGRTRQLDLIEPAYFAGRMDAYKILLRKGDTYSFKTSLGHYADFKEQKYNLILPKGKYSIAASFESEESSINQAQGIPYWKGRVISKPLEFSSDSDLKVPLTGKTRRIFYPDYFFVLDSRVNPKILVEEINLYEQ